MFAEIEPSSWCLDPDALRDAVGPCTRAVVPVHLYGYPARMDAIRAVADEHGLLVLEDAAAAAGVGRAGVAGIDVHATVAVEARWFP